jgi:integrase
VGEGLWEVSCSHGYREDGSRRVAYRFVRGPESKAEEERIRLVAEMGRNPRLGDPMTLDEYYWGIYSPDRHATTTVANAKTHDLNYRNHVADALGHMDIGSITYQDVRRWVEGLPPQSAPNYVRTLRSVLAQARYDGFIQDSPMDGRRFRMPKGRDTTPRPVWGAREVAEALGRPDFRRSQLFGLWCLMCGGGLSRSEALAIDWESIRWDEALGMDGRTHRTAYVSIDAAVTSMDGVKGPKNSRRYRTVPVPSVFADRLWEVRGSGPVCQGERHTSGGNVPTGHRLSPDRVPGKWRSYFEEGGCLHGLPFVWINRMRATNATLMQGAGVDSTLINAMQGRSSNSEVLYGHYLNPRQDSFERAADAMQRRVIGG